MSLNHTDCFFCKDPVFKRLPCGHAACSLCLADLVTDGSVCRAYPEDCESKCNVPFSVQEVLSPVLQEEPKTEEEAVEAQKAFDTLKTSIEKQKLRVREQTNVLETLYTALYEHKNTFPKEALEGQVTPRKAREAVEADMKAVGLRIDELKVYLDHLRVAETSKRMQQLLANPVNSSLPIYFTTAIADSGLMKSFVGDVFPDNRPCRFWP